MIPWHFNYLYGGWVAGVSGALGPLILYSVASGPFLGNSPMDKSPEKHLIPHFGEVTSGALARIIMKPNQVLVIGAEGTYGTFESGGQGYLQ